MNNNNNNLNLAVVPIAAFIPLFCLLCVVALPFVSIQVKFCCVLYAADIMISTQLVLLPAVLRREY